MPWRRFYAGRRDLLRFLALVLAEPDVEILETYSVPDRELRRFPDLAALEAEPMIGVDRPGTGAAVQLALWSRAVATAPRLSRIDLRPGAVPGATFRFTVDSPALFWLNCGGRGDAALSASALGWFTRSEAERKFAGSVPLDSVIWPAHQRLGRRLRALIERDLAVGRSGDLPVLAEAMELRRAGLRLGR
ncbi:MAG TPA: hypothetical protein VJP45_08455 [Candidatus Limnocylindria bacterium]|nr:hypothetical protein [Candidatus Limnocylindria bacterium]